MLDARNGQGVALKANEGRWSGTGSFHFFSGHVFLWTSVKKILIIYNFAFFCRLCSWMQDTFSVFNLCLTLLAHTDDIGTIFVHLHTGLAESNVLRVTSPFSSSVWQKQWRPWRRPRRPLRQQQQWRPRRPWSKVLDERNDQGVALEVNEDRWSGAGSCEGQMAWPRRPRRPWRENDSEIVFCVSG